MNEQYTITVNAISSSIHFLSIFLRINIVNRIKLNCLFSVKLCSFAILKAFLTQFWQLVLPVSNRQPNSLWLLWQKDDQLRVGSITANLIWEFSNESMLLFVCIVFLLLYFYPVTCNFSKVLGLLFWYEKLFGGYSEWSILKTVNLHLFELIAN